MQPFARIPTVLIVAAGLGSLAGCSTSETGIGEPRGELAALDPATRRAIQRGEVAAGYTPGMVRLALGKPTQVTTDPNGNAVWLYRRDPVTAANETIHAGFRRRVVYDPVKRTSDVIVEPVDTKAFPHLVPYTLTVVFQNDHVVSVTRLPAR